MCEPSHREKAVVSSSWPGESTAHEYILKWLSSLLKLMDYPQDYSILLDYIIKDDIYDIIL